MRTNYAGMKGGSQLKAFAGAAGDRAIVEQGIIAERVMKTWTDERKQLLRKYTYNVITLKRRADEINEWLEHKGPISMEEIKSIEAQYSSRCIEANNMMKALVADYADRMTKAGVSTSLGYNFYDLRGPAYLVYPVETPLRNMLARWGKVNAGYGTAVHWKYTSVGPGNGASSQQYAGAAEGKRVGTSLPNENDAIATYSELGVERAVTFTAEFAGEGYTDNVSDEHIRGLHQLELQEESIMWGGNAGTGTGLNGFQLGTANTPTLALAASIPAGQPSDGSVAGFTNNTTVSIRVVELTMLGYPNNGQYGYQAAPTVGATGLVPTYSRSDAGPYSDSDTIFGGMGQISASSAVSTAITSTPFVKAAVVPKKGAFAWAWFVDDQDATTPSTANAFLAAITTVPYCYFGSLSAHGLISGNQAASAAGLNADHSANTLDFSGVIAWAVTSGVVLNQSDISKIDLSVGTTNNGLLQPVEVGTSKTAAIAQLDYDLLQQWNAFQTVADEIWASADAKNSITHAIMVGGAQAYRFETTRDAQGNILGGAVVSGYKSIYSMKATGSDELPIRIHPMLPAGTIIYHKRTNPYPHSRIPGYDGMFVQRDYYGVEWPVNKRQWEFGTYVHETYGNYIPGLLTVRTGIQGVSTT